MTRDRRRTAALAAALAGGALAGCMTERVVTNDGRPLPSKPRRIAPAPAGLVPNRMTLLMGQKPEDSDGNGYPDRIAITTALFAYPAHPLSLEADGAFVFTLYRQGDAESADATPVAEWRYEGDDLRRARAGALYGPCYSFRLVLDHDAADAWLGDLRGRYEPAGGGSVVRTSEEVRSVRLGG